MTAAELLADQIRAGGRTTSTLNGLRITRLNGATVRVAAAKGETTPGHVATFCDLLRKAGYREGRALKASKTEGFTMEIKKR